MNSETEASIAKLGFEEAMFLKKIVDHLLLMTLNPSGEQGNEDLENHDFFSG